MSSRRAYSTRSGFLIVTTAAVAVGCHSYQQVPAEALAPGSTIRAELSDPGMLRVADAFGEPRRTLEGEIVGVEEGALLLLTRTGVSVVGVPGTSPSALRQRIRIEQQDVLRFEERQLQRGRTAALTAALTAAFVGVAVYFMTGRSGGDLERPVVGDPPVS